MNMKTAPRADRALASALRGAASYHLRRRSPRSSRAIALIWSPHTSPRRCCGRALLGRADELRDVELRTLGGMWIDYGFQNGSWSHVVRANTSSVRRRVVGRWRKR